MSGPILITGATGFIGRRLVARLLEAGADVRCLVRDPQSPRARELELAGASLRRGDLSRPEGLAEALDGVEVAYYLVHMISGEEDYPAIERAAAARFGRAATSRGVERTIYLGGLGANDASKHLAARHATAMALAEAGPSLTYFRAAMVIGPGSESYELLRGIVERLFVLPAPEWLDTKTQPIGDREVVSFLTEALEVEGSVGREIQIGGPDVITHLGLVREMAAALGRKPPRTFRVSTEIGRPETVAAGAAALTPGDPAIAHQISLGLRTPTIVTDSSGMAMFKTRRRRLDSVLAAAVDAARAEGVPA